MTDRDGHGIRGQRADVHTEDHGGRRISKGARVEHRLSATGLARRRAFLRGLEDEQGSSRHRVPHRGKYLGGGQHRGGMTVVPACVRHRKWPARVPGVDNGRGEVHARPLGHRQRVHVRPQGNDARSGQRSAQHSDDAVPGDPGPYLVQPGRTEALRDEPSRHNLAVRQLRMSVQVPARRG